MWAQVEQVTASTLEPGRVSERLQVQRATFKVGGEPPVPVSHRDS